MKRTKAFTLIELLVVISIIALLVSILMPALNKAKAMAKRTVCSTNERALGTAMLFYIDDNNDNVPIATSTVCNGSGEKGWIKDGTTTVTEREQYDNIREGSLYKYVDAVEVYRCPTSPLTQFISYGMSSQWYNESALTAPSSGVSEFYKKYSSCKRPVERMIFVETVGSDADGYWAIYYQYARWWNVVNWRHSKGTVNAYADNHVEYKKLVEETIELMENTYTLDQNAAEVANCPDQAENEDFQLFYKSIWGKAYNKQ